MKKDFRFVAQGENIKAARGKKNTTSLACSRPSTLNRGDILLVEKGKIGLNDEALQAIAEICNTTVEDLKKPSATLMQAIGVNISAAMTGAKRPKNRTDVVKDLPNLFNFETITKIVEGKIVPSDKQLKALAAYCGTNVKTLAAIDMPDEESGQAPVVVPAEVTVAPTPGR